MKLIDFNSRPPIPAFKPNASHLLNYRRVYQASEAEASKETEGERAGHRYLASVRAARRRARVVVKAKDVETTFGIKASNEAIAEFCAAQGDPPSSAGPASNPTRAWRRCASSSIAVRELGLRGLNLQCFEHPAWRSTTSACIRSTPSASSSMSRSTSISSINFSTDCLMEHGRPILLDEVIRGLFPELRVIASPPGWPWVARADRRRVAARERVHRRVGRASEVPRRTTTRVTRHCFSTATRCCRAGAVGDLVPNAAGRACRRGDDGASAGRTRCARNGCTATRRGFSGSTDAWIHDERA